MKIKILIILQICIFLVDIHSQDNYFEYLRTDKARYLPSDEVNFEIGLNDPPVDSYLLIKYKHLSELIKTDSIFNLQQNSWNWYLPPDDFKGYLVEVYLLQNDSTVDRINTAIDVSSDTKKYPRYGFLSKYSAMAPEQMDSVMKSLNDYHVNIIQFYDWHYKHHKPLSGTPQNPDAFWLDVANRMNYFETVNGYIGLAQNYNMKTMSYNLLYGALDNADADGVMPEWYLYKDANHLQKDYLDLSFWGHNIDILNPSNESWENYIFQKTQDAFSVLNFDGWHVDQLGDRGQVYNFEGQTLQLKNTFQKFLTDAKKYFNKVLVMNAVNQYGQYEISQAPVDFLYTEVWSPNTTFNSLASIILTNQNTYNDSLKTVLAAYVNHDLAENPGYFNIPAVLYADAVIFAFGGVHIELGEHMLGHEYFPNENLVMTNELKTKLKVYYDFLVAYENLLRDEGPYKQSELQEHDSTQLTGWPPQLGNITSFKKENEKRDIFHLINFKGATTLDWRDNSGIQHEPELLKEISLSFYCSKSVSKVWIASPDFNLGSPIQIEFIQQNDTVYLNIPKLKYWDVVVVEYTKPTIVESLGNNWNISYVLYQNYPNPFNSSTIIRYTVPRKGLIILKIFDVLGKEIVTLVKEEKNMGSYEINFNANSLTSGIYFYQLVVNQFRETKKMLLIK